MSGNLASLAELSRSLFFSEEIQRNQTFNSCPPHSLFGNQNQLLTNSNPLSYLSNISFSPCDSGDQDQNSSSYSNSEDHFEGLAVKKSHSTSNGGIRCDILFRSILRSLRKSLTKNLKRVNPSLTNTGKKEEFKIVEGLR